jgi:hypothetical protein
LKSMSGGWLASRFRFNLTCGLRNDPGLVWR